MKQKEMTFIEKAKFFLSPISYNPWVYTRATIEGCTDGVFSILTLVIFEYIARSIQIGDRDTFYSLIWNYGFITLGYVFLKSIIMRRWGWSELHNTIHTYAADTYLRKYISGDPNHTERIGTGRFISIYER